MNSARKYHLSRRLEPFLEGDIAPFVFVAVQLDLLEAVFANYNTGTTTQSRHKFFTSRVNVACAINLHFEPWLYGVLFAGCMLLYFLIRFLLIRRVNRISPAEVLKNRE